MTWATPPSKFTEHHLLWDSFALFLAYRSRTTVVYSVDIAWQVRVLEADLSASVWRRSFTQTAARWRHLRIHRPEILRKMPNHSILNKFSESYLQWKI